VWANGGPRFGVATRQKDETSKKVDARARKEGGERGRGGRDADEKEEGEVKTSTDRESRLPWSPWRRSGALEPGGGSEGDRIG